MAFVEISGLEHNVDQKGFLGSKVHNYKPSFGLRFPDGGPLSTNSDGDHFQLLSPESIKFLPPSQQRPNYPPPQKPVLFVLYRDQTPFFLECSLWKGSTELPDELQYPTALHKGNTIALKFKLGASTKSASFLRVNQDDALRVRLRVLSGDARQCLCDVDIDRFWFCRAGAMPDKAVAKVGPPVNTRRSKESSASATDANPYSWTPAIVGELAMPGPPLPDVFHQQQAWQPAKYESRPEAQGPYGLPSTGRAVANGAASSLLSSSSSGNATSMFAPSTPASSFQPGFSFADNPNGLTTPSLPDALPPFVFDALDMSNGFALPTFGDGVLLDQEFSGSWNNEEIDPNSLDFSSVLLSQVADSSATGALGALARSSSGEPSNAFGTVARSSSGDGGISFGSVARSSSGETGNAFGAMARSSSGGPDGTRPSSAPRPVSPRSTPSGYAVPPSLPPQPGSRAPPSAFAAPGSPSPAALATPSAAPTVTLTSSGGVPASVASSGPRRAVLAPDSQPSVKRSRGQDGAAPDSSSEHVARLHAGFEAKVRPLLDALSRHASSKVYSIAEVTYLLCTLGPIRLSADDENRMREWLTDFFLGGRRDTQITSDDIIRFCRFYAGAGISQCFNLMKKVYECRFFLGRLEFKEEQLALRNPGRFLARYSNRGFDLGCWSLSVNVDRRITKAMIGFNFDECKFELVGKPGVTYESFDDIRAKNTDIFRDAVSREDLPSYVAYSLSLRNLVTRELTEEITAGVASHGINTPSEPQHGAGLSPSGSLNLGGGRSPSPSRSPREVRSPRDRQPEAFSPPGWSGVSPDLSRAPFSPNAAGAAAPLELMRLIAKLKKDGKLSADVTTKLLRLARNANDPKLPELVQVYEAFGKDDEEMFADQAIDLVAT